MAGSGTGSKGGVGGQQATAAPTMAAPTQGQYAPLAPQGNFNVNQASAGALQQSMQGAQGGMGFQAGQLAGTNLSPYTNPYENQVVQQTLTDLGSDQEKQINQMGANATSAGAFGGSRHGIAEAETRKGFADTAAQTVSGLRQAGYTQACSSLSSTQHAANTLAMQDRPIRRCLPR